MIVHDIPLSRIKVSRDRFRDANENAIEELVVSYGKFGQLTPIIIEPSGEDFELIAGLHRVVAARAAKWITIAAVMRDDVDEVMAREIELEENIRRLDMKWLDRAKAIAAIDELRRKTDPNWTLDQTAAIAGVSDKSDVSRANNIVKMVALFPELAESKSLHQAMTRAKDKAGQIYRVQEVKDAPEVFASIEERIWLGDSRSRIREVPDGAFGLVLTDPPFGINYDERKADTAGSVNTYQDDEEYYITILAMAPELFRVLKNNGTLIWFLGISWYERAKVAFRGAGFNVDEIPIIWDRSDGRTFTSRPDRWFGRGYDIALHAIKGDAKLVQRGKPNVIRVPPVGTEDRELVVERPVELYQELIRRCTLEGETVADFFVGSGSCPAAAASLKRQYFGCELDPERRAVAIKKILAHTPS